MGRGNVATLGKYESLYYIDNDDLYVYRLDDAYGDEAVTSLMRELDSSDITNGAWYYDEEGTENEREDVETYIAEAFCKRFPSFRNRIGEPYKWIRAGTYGDFSRRVLAENDLYYLCVEDNEWSEAVELIQKECWYDNHLEGLQKRHFQSYLDGLKDVMLERLPSIGFRTGAWTSGVIERD